MSSSSALIAKEKVNLSSKCRTHRHRLDRRDVPRATQPSNPGITPPSSGTTPPPSSPTQKIQPTLNRAAAYLKLGKNEDAERDCGEVLSLSPKNVKALFRCGQARIELQKLAEARQGDPHGGIFCASGEHTEFSPYEAKSQGPKEEVKSHKEVVKEHKDGSVRNGESSSLTLPAPVTLDSVGNTKPPMKLFDFTRIWESSGV
ncbi:hypothetical protein EW146_g1818 [Bondarzewia mesenterica]|uniref:Uncharacterized protein n=1 Tax=Bondarzewia mesenterica TaxID=1095465 RepID=A0A4S4M2S6_9AGAM|nr:hypothetical protein EW146_g1818 [Bondarzewia mesenterica]